MTRRSFLFVTAGWAIVVALSPGCGKPEEPITPDGKTFADVAKHLDSDHASVRAEAARILKNVPPKYPKRARAVLQLALADEPDPKVRALIQAGILANKARIGQSEQ